VSRRHLVDPHCFGTDWRPGLAHDDGVRGASGNQRRGQECRRADKFHIKLNSCRTAELRPSVGPAGGLSGRIPLCAPSALPPAPAAATRHLRERSETLRITPLW